MITLGFDTSNYTTSVAWFDGRQGENCSRLLPVKVGELGLRQADALFAHTKSLPDLADRLFSHVEAREVVAVGVSTRPRAVEGSYMPCFLAGVAQARAIASLLHVPLVEVSHQQGHLAAALWGAGRMELMQQRFLAWHLSGGTTELLLVEPEALRCSRIGGTTDISAGQLIDRTGKLLGLPFPAGKALDEWASQAEAQPSYRVKCPELEFSLSGMQNQVEQYYRQSGLKAETAAFALGCVCSAVTQATEHAMARYPGLAVVFSGGVSSNSMLRSRLAPVQPVFCPPALATDNAQGVAVLAWRRMEESHG